MAANTKVWQYHTNISVEVSNNAFYDQKKNNASQHWSKYFFFSRHDTSTYDDNFYGGVVDGRKGRGSMDCLCLNIHGIFLFSTELPGAGASWIMDHGGAKALRTLQKCCIITFNCLVLLRVLLNKTKFIVNNDPNELANSLSTVTLLCWGILTLPE